MKWPVLLVGIFIIFGCDGDPVSSYDPEFFIGTWEGISQATYPGPDDAPITREEPIRFIFSESTFQYYWIGPNGNESIPYGSGNYTIGDSSMTFSDMILSGFEQTMDLRGVFIIGMVDSTLSLIQEPPSFWHTYHLVTLDKIDTISIR